VSDISNKEAVMKAMVRITGLCLILAGFGGLFAQPYIENPGTPLIYPQSQRFPKIDGEMDDIWLNVPRNVIANYAIAGKLEGNPWYDCSAEWRAMWNDQALFFYAECRDDSLQSKGTDYTGETDGYRWDSFEFYNDADHSRGTDYDGVDDVQFRVHENDLARTIWVWTNLKGPQFDISEFEWSEKRTEHGWAVEFMAIMDEIFLFPSPGTIIGTDVEYNDNDHQKGREHKVISFGNSEGSHAHPDYYGEAVLSGWTASDTLMIARAGRAPVIDGVWDDAWGGVPAIAGNRYMSMDKLRNYSDCSMNTRIMWDSENLYGLVRVWDDTLMRDGSGDFNDDSFELYVDGDYSHGSVYDRVNDFQFEFSYQNAAQPVAPIHLAGSSVGTPIDFTGVRQASTSFIDTIRVPKGKTTILDTTGFGFVLEFAIPMASLHIAPAAGRLIGVEMDYNDDDDGGERDTQMKTYSKMDESSQNPGRMQPARLIAFTAGELNGVAGRTPRPSGCDLTQNYPNPFNPVTDIGFTIPSPQRVRLAVYDITGRRVRVLTDGFLPAGRHRATFEAEGLASGVYLYRLETRDRVVTKKMTLIR
jgi:hypothetical protein